MSKLFVLAVSLSSWIPAILDTVTTSAGRVVLEGRTVTVACHYEPQYAGYVKYWCQGSTREFCKSLARTDDARSDDAADSKVSIVDDPVQQVSTVTMANVKAADSGWYMCAVEIGGGWTADAVVVFANIQVIHGLSVVQNVVSGEEGGAVSLECHYSERLRESEKKWCRLGDWSSCRPTGPDWTYEDSSVAISDDRTGALTVTLKELQQTDSGWYWCFAGQQQIAVQVVVTPRPAATTSVTTPVPEEGPCDAQRPPTEPIGSWSRHWPIDQPLVVLVCSSLLVLMAMATLGRYLWRKHKPSLLPLDQEPTTLRREQAEKAGMN